jgi:hypothetical protein
LPKQLYVKYNSPHINLETAVRITQSNGATEKSRLHIRNNNAHPAIKKHAIMIEIIVFIFSCLTVRAVDPFGQSFRPTGVQLPGWDFTFLAFGFF